MIDIKTRDGDGKLSSIPGRERPLHRNAGYEVLKATVPPSYATTVRSRTFAVLQMLFANVKEKRLVGSGLPVGQ